MDALISVGSPYSIIALTGKIPVPVPVSFVVNHQLPTVPELDSPQHTFAELGTASLTDVLSMPSPSLLRVSIHMLAAEAENAGKFHINVRRTSGSHWLFQDFYTAFRRAFSKMLGLSNEKALSMYSPMMPKRVVPTRSPFLAPAPAPGWGFDPRSRRFEKHCETSGLASIRRTNKRPWQP
eukprot:CAMPEP_0174735836 /NCGR_PEP_ID=MMETSP1094-20130205/65635_1 /TAXON_ID=156173 /ORGANISM="Chrysochromulina brevifilum, Strain UTEX LB 985" /LENGTH=179 /DNA_ID=CAMNT_0015938849 /DNA_START=171 /DNA_END=710 /DNA_ORIENTATION=+